MQFEGEIEALHCYEEGMKIRLATVPVRHSRMGFSGNSFGVALRTMAERHGRESGRERLTLALALCGREVLEFSCQVRMDLFGEENVDTKTTQRELGAAMVQAERILSWFSKKQKSKNNKGTKDEARVGEDEEQEDEEAGEERRRLKEYLRRVEVRIGETGGCAVTKILEGAYRSESEVCGDLQVREGERKCVLGEQGPTGVLGKPARVVAAPGDDGREGSVLAKVVRDAGGGEWMTGEVARVLYEEVSNPQPVLRRVGGRRVLFTAPHSIYLRRDGHAVHVPECITHFLAVDAANWIGCSALTWRESEIRRSKETRQPHPKAIDPNYTAVTEMASTRWYAEMEAWLVSGAGSEVDVAHFDIHGCKDRSVDGRPVAMEIGSFGMKNLGGGETALAKLRARLQVVVGSGWVIACDDVFTGRGKGEGSHCTLVTQSAVLLAKQSEAEEIRAVVFVLEITRSFRTLLVMNSPLRYAMYAALASME